ncbi:MAG: hypothetical protein IPJ03_19395 [Ignavibacteriales bacterium]|nr:hypothetical protein [Ignavibacteriales bacterium]MBK7381122.1 hypothetical protein [Ignavibacteriales bacterium]
MKIILYLIVISTIFLSACSPSVNFMKYSEDTFPPSNSVEVLRNKLVEKDFVELGELSLQVKKGIFSNQEEAVLKLKEKAKEIGADAIIILGEESEGSVIVPIGKLYTSVDKRYIKAIAIKYKN